MKQFFVYTEVLLLESGIMPVIWFKEKEKCDFVFDVASSYMQKARLECHCLKSVLVYAIGT